jgi:hypothetical protein
MAQLSRCRGVIEYVPQVRHGVLRPHTRRSEPRVAKATTRRPRARGLLSAEARMAAAILVIARECGCDVAVLRVVTASSAKVRSLRCVCMGARIEAVELRRGSGRLIVVGARVKFYSNSNNAPFTHASERTRQRSKKRAQEDSKRDERTSSSTAIQSAPHASTSSSAASYPVSGEQQDYTVYKHRCTFVHQIQPRREICTPPARLTTTPRPLRSRRTAC